MIARAFYTALLVYSIGCFVAMMASTFKGDPQHIPLAYLSAGIVIGSIAAGGLRRASERAEHAQRHHDHDHGERP